PRLVVRCLSVRQHGVEDQLRFSDFALIEGDATLQVARTNVELGVAELPECRGALAGVLRCLVKNLLLPIDRRADVRDTRQIDLWLPQLAVCTFRAVQ